MVGLNLHSTQSMLSFSPSYTPTKQHSIMLMLTITALLSSRLPSSLAVCRGERCVCNALHSSRPVYGFSYAHLAHHPVRFWPTATTTTATTIVTCILPHPGPRTLKAVHTQPYRFRLEFTSKLPVIKVNHRLNRYWRGMVRDGETANRAKGSHKAHTPSRHANSPAARGDRRRSTVSFGTAN